MHMGVWQEKMGGGGRGLLVKIGEFSVYIVSL